MKFRVERCEIVKYSFDRILYFYEGKLSALVGGTAIESQNVVNGSVVSYKVKWNPRRQFAVDMAGFAISLDVVLK